MPPHAVDEAWHGLILCAARYSAFCGEAYGELLHHHPEGGAPPGVAARSDPMADQLRRTVIAWTLVANPGRAMCPMGSRRTREVEQLWEIDRARVTEIESDVARITAAERNS